jgi:hypothetical protein
MMTISRLHKPLIRIGALGALAACTAVSAAPAGAASTAPAVCAPSVSKGVLPPWARGGFSAARPKIAHITGASGSIMAILFAQPLEAPPAKTHNNKILWVSKTDINTYTNLRISAQQMRGTRTIGKPVTRVVGGGPGPSIIDLPAAGCWRFDLKWAGHRDTLDLRYARNTA